jgi:hypothetical protein
VVTFKLNRAPEGTEHDALIWDRIRKKGWRKQVPDDAECKSFSDIQEFVNSICKKEELLGNGSDLLLYPCTKMEIKLILAVTKKYYLPATYRILGNIMC